MIWIPGLIYIGVLLLLAFEPNPMDFRKGRKNDSR